MENSNLLGRLGNYADFGEVEIKGQLYDFIYSGGEFVLKRELREGTTGIEMYIDKVYSDFIKNDEWVVYEIVNSGSSAVISVNQTLTSIESRALDEAIEKYKRR